MFGPTPTITSEIKTNKAKKNKNWQMIHSLSSLSYNWSNKTNLSTVSLIACQLS